MKAYAKKFEMVGLKTRSFEKWIKIGIERFDRSSHMWWNQEEERAGPLRTVSNWNFPWVPELWTEIPVTWSALARCAEHIDVGSASYLPLPFRIHLAKHKMDTAETSETKNIWKSLSCGNFVTCKLSLEQNRQLLWATYVMKYATFDSKNFEVACEIARSYVLYGFLGRQIGLYDQDAAHIGFGGNVRKFKHMQQYETPNIPLETWARVIQPDGSIKGTGFKGTRGKHNTRNLPRFSSGKRMKRDKEKEDLTRIVRQ
jgi:hypothetical protein